MVPGKQDEHREAKSLANSVVSRRKSVLLELARGILSKDENDFVPHDCLQLNEDEPWERSLRKLLGDSSSSLYSSQETVDKPSGVFMLAHSDSRDICFEMEHPSSYDEGSQISRITSTTSRLEHQRDIYRLDSTKVDQGISLLDSSTDSRVDQGISLLDSSIDTRVDQGISLLDSCTDSSSEAVQLPTALKILSTLRHTHSADSGRIVERRQELDQMRDLSVRRGWICNLRNRQRQEYVQTARSFDDVTNFSEEVNLPYLPSLDEPSSIDDSNTLRRLTLRCDLDHCLAGSFSRHSSIHETVDRNLDD